MAKKDKSLETLPYSETSLVLGVCSVSFGSGLACLFLIFPILIFPLIPFLAIGLGIPGIIYANKGDLALKNESDKYKKSSINSNKAGKICSIIGISLGSLQLFLVILFIFLGLIS